MARQVGSRAPAGWERCVPAHVLAQWRPFPVDLGEGEATMAVAKGSGPTLLLIPPLVGWKESMWAQVDGLSERFRVTVFDLREGNGRGPTWERLLEDVDHVASALPPGALVVLGHSLGGALALQWALRRPERTAGLILSSMYSHIRFDAETWWTRFVVQGAVLAANRLLPEGVLLRAARAGAKQAIWVYDPHCDPALIRLVRLGVRGTPARVAMGRVRLARAFDARPLLGRVRCPTLVMVGERESRFARESAEILKGGIGHAELRVIAEANHLVHISRAALYNETVAEWWRGRRAPHSRG